jgi:hypothetical protein
MRLSKLSDRKTFSYCKVKSLKEFDVKKVHIKVGDFIYAMLYPSNHWYLFNTNDETEGRQHELMVCAVEGKDFEDIKEETTNKEND